MITGQLIVGVASGVIVAVVIGIGTRGLRYLKTIVIENRLHAKRVEAALDAVEKHLKVNGSEPLLPKEYAHDLPLRDLVIQIAVGLSAHIADAARDRELMNGLLLRYDHEHPSRESHEH